MILSARIISINRSRIFFSASSVSGERRNFRPFLVQLCRSRPASRRILANGASVGIPTIFENFEQVLEKLTFSLLYNAVRMKIFVIYPDDYYLLLYTAVRMKVFIVFFLSKNYWRERSVIRVRTSLKSASVGIPMIFENFKHVLEKLILSLLYNALRMNIFVVYSGRKIIGAIDR